VGVPERAQEQSPVVEAPEKPPPNDPEPGIDEPAPKPTDHPAKASSPPSPPLEIEITKLTKVGGPLTKRISMAADGTLLNDGSACIMSQGSAERIKIDGVAALAFLIENLKPSQALALGVLRADLPDKVDITTKKRLLNGKARPDIVARSGANIVHHGPAFALLDYDTKAMPTNVAAGIQRAGGFWPTLTEVLPILKDAAHVTRKSTSAGLSRTDTGEVLLGSDGIHVYVAVKDGADTRRFLKALHDRCWLAGFGWMMVGAGGIALERSIIDRMVGGPERLVFEGGPILVPPLVQDKESRRPTAVEGITLDTAGICPSLTIVEGTRLNDLKARERDRLAAELAEARAAFIKTQVGKLVMSKGLSERAARQIITRLCEGMLRPDIELPFDDADLAGCTVADVLADPERFVGETLADPIEGVIYGRCVAKIMRQGNGVPWIHSFAHGRIVYELKYDAAAVRKAMEACVKDDVVATFARLAADADLDAIEMEDLRRVAKELSGVGLRVINDALKATKQRHAADSAKATRSRQTARRRDPRPQLPSPSLDASWLPQMDVLNEVIGAVVSDMPPIRDIDDDAMSIRDFSIPGTHAFINPEGDDE
jgi:hypothetical protein